MQHVDLVVVGGGAAGFFSAINAAKNHPQIKILILEKNTRVLTKVKVSGGGRCNVTHDALYNSQLLKSYPRGSRFLKKVFRHFAVKETIDWFKSEGVQLKTEADGRMFPVTDDSETIINCLMSAVKKNEIQVQTKCAVKKIVQQEKEFRLVTTQGDLTCDKLILTPGGLSKPEQYQWLEFTGHQIIPPVPSLFTFNIAYKQLHELAGITLPHATVKVQGHKMQQQGGLLITHWGLSGPAVLKLSAWGARLFHDLNYCFDVLVHWNADLSPKETEITVTEMQDSAPGKKVINTHFPGIPQRLWAFIIENSLENNQKTWQEISKKEFHRILENLYSFNFNVKGKTTFKEEFVTCGGIDTGEINPDTMESKNVKNLYFAGEILNVDGITGGYNFQAAWSTAYVAGKLKGI